MSISKWINFFENDSFFCLFILNDSLSQYIILILTTKTNTTYKKYLQKNCRSSQNSFRKRRPNQTRNVSLLNIRNSVQMRKSCQQSQDKEATSGHMPATMRKCSLQHPLNQAGLTSILNWRRNLQEVVSKTYLSSKPTKKTGLRGSVL